MRRSLLPLVILAILSLAVAAIAADKVPPKTNDGRNVYHTEAVRAYMEGFEGAFPPAGWTQTITNASYTWVQDFAVPYEGAAAAYIPWQAGNPQNEVLSFTHLIDSAANEDHLVFATQGSVYWSPYATLTVEVNGLEVYNFGAEFTAGNFVWDMVDVDLSGYDGQTVTIAFIYAGDDGADHYLDAVSLDEGAPPPPPPPANDLCENAIDLQAQGLTEFTVDLCLAANDYTAGVYPASCTGFGSTGKDVVYKIYLGLGETFTASMQGSHDAALWLVTDCADPTNTCVVGADDTVSEGFETITYSAAAAGWYYLIVDGYGTDSCSMTTVTIDAPVGNQDASWSDVKSMYR